MEVEHHQQGHPHPKGGEDVQMDEAGRPELPMGCTVSETEGRTVWWH